MSGPVRGPLVPYQVVWRSGHIETIHAHQVLWPNTMGALFGNLNEVGPDPRVFMHGEVDGHWRLLLAADAADILSVRALTGSEEVTQ